MTRRVRILIACALAVFLAACRDLPAIFEDVGDDPHPPELTLLGIGVQLPTSDPDNPPPPPAYVPPAAGIIVRPYDDGANRLALRFSYADRAADIATVVVRDLDGSINHSVTFTDFLGTAGIREITDIPIQATVAGPHRLEVWAEDVAGSRSAKTTFVVTVEYR